MRRRLFASVVVLGTSIAACVGVEHLSSTAQEAVVITSPNPIAFGSVQTGDTSGSQSIVLAPASGSGDSNDTVQMITFSCPDFTVDKSSLPALVFRHCDGAGTGTASQMVKRGTLSPDIDPDGVREVQAICLDPDIRTASFPATFHPSAAGSQACSVTLSGTFGTRLVTLTGTGVLPPHQIDVTPKSIDFGDVRKDAQSDVSYDIRNTGAMPLAVSSIDILSGKPNPFSTDGTAMVIPVGGKVTFTASCHPKTFDNGTVDAVRIISDATNLPTAMIPLACHGIDSPLDHDTAIAFEMRAHETQDKQLRITNTGNVSTTITGVTITGTANVIIRDGFPAGPNPPPASFALAQNGGFRDLTLRYHTEDPETVDTGVNLAIAHDGTADNVKLQLASLATAFGTDAPEVIEFGPVCSGSTADMPAVHVFASLDGGFTLDAVAQPGTPFGWGGAMTGTAAAHHTNDLTFLPSVAPLTKGLQMSTVTLTTDIPNDATHAFTLVVDAKDIGTTAEPPMTDYGPVEAASITAFKTIKFTNCSGHDLAVTDSRIDGDAAADFKVVGPDPFARTLAQAETMEIQVVMAPQAKAAGIRNATLVILHADGDTTADLTGVATGVTAAVDPSTYYACNVGGSGGLAIGLAVLVMLRRRRRR